MRFEKPTIEFIELDNNSIVVTGSNGRCDDGTFAGGAGGCEGDISPTFCADWAPLAG